jgi:hypothetical protein
MQPSISICLQFADRADCQSFSNALPSTFSLVQRVERILPQTSLQLVCIATTHGIRGNGHRLLRPIARMCESAWWRAGGWQHMSRPVSAECRKKSERSAEWCPPNVEDGVSDPAPSTGVETGRPTACPAPKELATYSADQIPSHSGQTRLMAAPSSHLPISARQRMTAFLTTSQNSSFYIGSARAVSKEGFAGLASLEASRARLSLRQNLWAKSTAIDVRG